MLNMIRADLYRTMHSKVLLSTFIMYLFSIVFLAVIVLDSGYEALLQLPSFTELVVLFMLPVIFAVAASDFQYRTIKNTLSGGASRIKIYASKSITVILFGIILFVGGFLLLSVIGTALYGFGKDITTELIISTLQATSMQMILVIGAVLIGTSITFITKSAVVFGSIYPIFFYGMWLISSMVAASFKNPNIKILSIISNIRNIGIESITRPDMIQALSVTVAYIVLSTTIGICSFRKSEI